MLNPHSIEVGKTYVVRFGDHMQSVKIKGRMGDSLQNFAWRGTITETGELTRIRNIGRFVNEVPPDQVDGLPWLLVLDVPKEIQLQKNPVLECFSVSIREQDSLRLVADLPDIPTDTTPHCAEVICNAVRICQSGPANSNTEHLHLFDDDTKTLHTVSVDLDFDTWDSAFASDVYFKSLRWKIEAAIRQLALAPHIIGDNFQTNSDGAGAVYWTEEDGIVNVLWTDKLFLKVLSLQSEKDITNFAESLFGEYGHSFCVLRQQLATHEGEWFDPPENLHYYHSYKAAQFDSVFIGILPKVYESDAEEGKRYYGRIVACEHKESWPEITKWTEHENKIWFRVNKNTDDQDYTGPFENHLSAAQEAYRQFFS